MGPLVPQSIHQPILILAANASGVISVTPANRLLGGKSFVFAVTRKSARPCYDLPVGLALNNLRNHIGVEKITHDMSTLRVGVCLRPRSILVPIKGEWR